MENSVISRPLILVLGILILMAQGLPAAAQQKLVFSFIGPLDTAQGEGLQLMAERLDELTNGELILDIYPDSQLGDQGSSLEQARQGTIDALTISPGEMSEFLPEVQVFVIPFVFSGFEHWNAVVTGTIGEEIAEAAKNKAGVIVLGYFGGSVRQLVSKRQVISVADMENLLIRLHPSDVQLSAWRSVGVVPTVIAYNELYNALQLGVTHALENEPEWIERMKFYEQAPYIGLTNHEVVTRLVLFSKDNFEKLSPEHQQAVLQAAHEATAFERKIEREYDSQKLKELEEQHGAIVSEIDDIDIFREKVQGGLAPVIEKLGLTDLVSRIQQVRP